MRSTHTAPFEWEAVEGASHGKILMYRQLGKNGRKGQISDLTDMKAAATRLDGKIFL